MQIIEVYLRQEHLNCFSSYACGKSVSIFLPGFIISFFCQDLLML